MGWLIALAVVAALAMLPLGIRAQYDAGGGKIALIAGPFCIPLKSSKKKKQQEKPKTEEKKAASGAGGSKKGGSAADFMPLVRTALDFLKDVRRKLRVNMLELKVILAGDDPCDLGVHYGQANAVAEGLMPLLEECFVIKKRDVQILCDFTAEKTLVFARVDLTITLARILSLGFKHGIRAIKEFVKLGKLRKGGA